MSNARNLSVVPNQSLSFKNRIINGDCRIDQRYAGAAFGTAINGYTVDRWSLYQSVTGKLNGGQNYNSVTPPSGFTKYLGVQSQSAYSVIASDFYVIGQAIEGFNVADLGWGTANAAPITITARVYSSLTGTFGGSIKNGAHNRSYPFTYTIPAANTWTTVSIVIPGDTSGTWATDNTTGMYVNFGLGVGSTYSGTAGSWAGANYVSATGSVSVVGTSGATFYITGVQVEKGTVATGFDYRPYGTELALCQRYYETTLTDSAGQAMMSWFFSGSGNNRQRWWFKQNKRANPTITAPLGWTGSTPSSVDVAVDGVGFYSTSLFYILGSANVIALTANSEL